MGRYKIRTACLLFVLLVTLTATVQGAGVERKKSLTEIYKTGKVEFVSQFELTADTMPVATKSLCWLHPGQEYLYAVDIEMNDIKVLTLQGKFVKTFGQKGRGPSDLGVPGTIVPAGDHLAVWEVANRRFSIFTKKGEFVKSAKMKHTGYVSRIQGMDNGEVVIERVKTVRENKEFFQLISLDLYSSDLEFKKTIYRKKV
ncbi:MAG: hypothetical protein GY765_08670, partial [bacterium]|nr:hypothetical protein [bacterium]